MKRGFTEGIGVYGSAGYREVNPFDDEQSADHGLQRRLQLPQAS